MPALVQFLVDEFEVDFEYIDRLAHDGGLQLIQEMKHNLMDVLNDERLPEAEQVFALVAMPRMAKAGICAALGPTRVLSMAC